MLSGVNVALGVTGSIAAVTVVELAHELRRQGGSVRAIMTDSAQGIVTADAVEYATDNPVVTELTGEVEHVDLCGDEGWADVLLIAPATANTIGKLAAAIDDTPVTTTATTAFGSGIPVVVASAMHEPMYDHPGVERNLETLEAWGVRFVDPRIEEGKAKIATEDAIVTETARAATPDTLAGKHVVVTSGATSEPIDPVRILTSRASGRTGRAVARACYVAGADVTLVHDGGDVSGTTASITYADERQVETAAEMLAAVENAVGGGEGDGGGDEADALVSAAAIGDFTVEAEDEKIRSGEARSLDLEPTPKLLDTVRESHPDLTMVGFKAETSGDDDALVEHARQLAERVGLAFVVANDASVMGAEDTRALFVAGDDVTAFSGSKTDLGTRVATELTAVLAD